MTAQAVPYASKRAKVVRQTAGRTGGPRIVPLVFFTILVIAVFFSMIYLRIALDRSAFELDTLNDQIVLEESRQLDLRLEIAQLQNPQRIAAAAEVIGLVYPEERVAVVVDGITPSAELTDDGVPLRALRENSP
ncbi:MAG: hypothetical protein BMS9Abin12_0947 [Acidimicrobiia bacterium]|nr:MAG: hypothetical protein BMS9Abin12_0947 [Acidimicrobiia bacterium]